MILKVLGADVTARASDRKRIKRELSKQAVLSSDVLALPVVSGDDDGCVWLLRSDEPGLDLEARLSDGALSRVHALMVGEQLAGALHELHQAGLLHRGLAPSHIVIRDGSHGPAIRVLDAGLSPNVDLEGVRVSGVPGYMAPEQLAGKLTSFRSDLYALGVVLYEMLTGDRLFADLAVRAESGEADAVSVWLSAHRDADRPELPESWPAELRALIGSLLARDPKARPASAQAAREAISELLPEELRHSAGVSDFPRSAMPSRPPAPPAAASMPAQSPVAYVPPAPPSPPEILVPKPPVSPAATVGVSSLPQHADATQELTALDLEDIDEILSPAAPVCPDQTQQMPAVQLEALGAESGAVDEEIEELEDLDDLLVSFDLGGLTPDDVVGESLPPGPFDVPTGSPFDPFASSATTGGAAPISFDDFADDLVKDAPPGIDHTPRPFRPEAMAPHGASHVNADYSGHDDVLPDLASAEEFSPSLPDGALPQTREMTVVSRLPRTQVMNAQELASATRIDPDATDNVPALAFDDAQKRRKKWPLLLLVAAPVLLGAVAAALLLTDLWSSGEEELAGPVRIQQALEPAPTAGSEAPLNVVAEVAPEADLAEERLPEEGTDDGFAEDALNESELALAEDGDVLAENGDVLAENGDVLAENGEDPSATDLDGELAADSDEEPALVDAAESSAAESPAAESPADDHQTAADRTAAAREAAGTFQELRQRAGAHARAGRYRQALGDYQRAAAIRSHAGIYAGMGACYLALGQARPAIQAYQRALQLNPSSSGFYAALGRAYLQAGDRTRARQAYQRALTLNPNNAAARAALAQL